jgi:SAM-dependent methyltransferase
MDASVRGMATYTHGHAESVLRSHRWRTVENSAAYLIPHLAAGQRVLDVGSGPGTITVDLAERVAPGRVTAVEINEAALDLTRVEAAKRGVDTIDFVVSDVHALDFPDGGFDIVHAHQVLQHVGDPVQALREMRRVAKPGGVVAARDSDYQAFTWFPESSALDQWLGLYRSAARANGGEPDAGRRLLSWAHAAGFADVTATSSTWCFATPEDRQYWGGMWATRILTSDLTAQLLRTGAATQDQLQAISDAFTRWIEDQDGWFSLLHGEIIALSNPHS